MEARASSFRPATRRRSRRRCAGSWSTKTSAGRWGPQGVNGPCGCSRPTAWWARPAHCMLHSSRPGSGAELARGRRTGAAAGNALEAPEVETYCLPNYVSTCAPPPCGRPAPRDVPVTTGRRLAAALGAACAPIPERCGRDQPDAADGVGLALPLAVWLADGGFPADVVWAPGGGHLPVHSVLHSAVARLTAHGRLFRPSDGGVGGRRSGCLRAVPGPADFSAQGARGRRRTGGAGTFRGAADLHPDRI